MRSNSLKSHLVTLIPGIHSEFPLITNKNESNGNHANNQLAWTYQSLPDAGIIGLLLVNTNESILKRALLEEQRLRSILHIQQLLFFIRINDNQLMEYVIDRNRQKDAVEERNRRNQAIISSNKTKQQIAIALQGDLFFSVISFLSYQDKLIFEQVSRKIWLGMNDTKKEKKIWEEKIMWTERKLAIAVSTKKQVILYSHIKNSYYSTKPRFTLLPQVAKLSPHMANEILNTSIPELKLPPNTPLPLPDRRNVLTKFAHAIGNMLLFSLPILGLIAWVTILSAWNVTLGWMLPAIDISWRRSVLGVSIFPILTIFSLLGLSAYYGWKYGASHINNPSFDVIRTFIVELFSGISNSRARADSRDPWCFFDRGRPVSPTVTPWTTALNTFEKSQKKIVTLEEYAAEYHPSHSPHLPKMIT